MASAIEQLPSGLTIGHAQLGLHGAQQGTINQQVHDGDTVTTLLDGNLRAASNLTDARPTADVIRAGQPSRAPPAFLPAQRWVGLDRPVGMHRRTTTAGSLLGSRVGWQNIPRSARSLFGGERPGAGGRSRAARVYGIADFWEGRTTTFSRYSADRRGGADRSRTLPSRRDLATVV